MSNRHQRRRDAARMRSMEIPASRRMRIMKFIDAFHAAPNDADIEIKIGAIDDGQAAVLVTINGSGYGLTVTEARKVADTMEEVMNAHPADPEGATLPNIIMALRFGSDAAESARTPPAPRATQEERE